MIPFSDKSEVGTVLLDEIPRSFYSNIKKRDELKISFYQNLLQYTVRNRAMILDLDTLTEVQTIEAIDSIQDPDHMVDTGLRMFTSRTDVEDDKKTTTRTRIKSNENGNLLFKREMKLNHDSTRRVYNSGSLYRTHTETDLYEL